MNMMDMLAKGGGIEAIASQLGISHSEARSGAEALLPAVMGGFAKRGQAGGGLGDLVGMLGGLGGGTLANNVVAPEPTEVAKGNDILGQIFGSKDVSRTVAGTAAGHTGLNAGTLKKMLPMLAMLVGGYMSHRASGGAQTPAGNMPGGLGGIIGSVLGGAGGGAAASAGGLGGLASMLDFGSGGNPLDHILGMAGRTRG